MERHTFLVVSGMVFVVAGVPIATVIGPRMWRGRMPHHSIDVDRVPAGWLWGVSGWHAAIRGWLLGASAVPIAGCFFLAVAFTIKPLAIFLLAFLIAWFLLLVSVVLFNRPRFAVPPVFRPRPGLIREMLDQREGGQT